MRKRKERDYCCDCGKPAPIHYVKVYKFKEFCCYSFLYYVENWVWSKAFESCEDKNVKLCLFCLKTRLNTEFEIQYFYIQSSILNGFLKTEQSKQNYYKRLTEYANSGQNNSRIW